MISTDILTYTDATGKIVYELERLPTEYQESVIDDGYFPEFAFTIHVNSEDEPYTFDMTLEDFEILQRVANDAINDRV